MLLLGVIINCNMFKHHGHFGSLWCWYLIPKLAWYHKAIPFSAHILNHSVMFQMHLVAWMYPYIDWHACMYASIARGCGWYRGLTCGVGSLSKELSLLFCESELCSLCFWCCFCVFGMCGLVWRLADVNHHLLLDHLLSWGSESKR